jgi:hypothetical protein
MRYAIMPSFGDRRGGTMYIVNQRYRRREIGVCFQLILEGRSVDNVCIWTKGLLILLLLGSLLSTVMYISVFYFFLISGFRASTSFKSEVFNHTSL